MGHTKLWKNQGLLWMLEILYSNQFKKDYKKTVKHHCDIEELFKVIELIKN